MDAPLNEQAIYAIERPSPKLMQYYALCALLAGPFFPIALLPLFFKYHTLRYRFTAEGVSMRWGILFRREVILNYARIQDIHLTSNIVERWLGLARVQIQTASGSANAEMTIEGIEQFEAIRDFLYSKMRGLKEGLPSGLARRASAVQATSAAEGRDTENLAFLLRQTAAELRALRLALEEKRSGEGESSHA